MARTLSFSYKRGELIQTTPANITFDEENNGRAFLYAEDDLADLLVDLESGKGITSPIWVAPHQTELGQGLKLVAGHRRLLAALQYAKNNPNYLIRCLVVEPKDEQEALEMNARENSKRRALSIIDQGHVALRLREEPTNTGGRTLAEIADILNISQAQVSQAMKLVEQLPERAQRAVHFGWVTVDDALTILKVPDPQTRENLVAEYITSGNRIVPEVISVPDPLLEPEIQSENESETPETPETPRNVRTAAREAGARVGLRLPELKKYLKQAVDEDGPGSNKGEVEIKKGLLDFISGKFGEKKMDSIFGSNCKVKGA